MNDNLYQVLVGTVEVRVAVTHALKRRAGGKIDDVKATFDQLESLLGPPTHEGSPDNKVDFIWSLDVDGSLVELWNYKDGPGYGHDVSNINHWSMGGNRLAVRIFKQLIEQEIE